MIIKFSSDYPKLWGQKQGRLLGVYAIAHELHKDLIEYDIKKSDGSYYPLPKGTVIQLVFLGDKGIPFCTIRRFTPNKFSYYVGLVGEDLKIQIMEEELG